MTSTWLALVDDEALLEGSVAYARVREGGWLAAWPEDGDRVPEGAWHIDPRAVDPKGDAVTVGLAAAPAGVSLPFDDPAVTGAIRSALSSEPPTLCTALSVGDGAYAGILISPPHLATPFATIFPQRTLHVAAGLLGRVPPPTGPGTQRYRPRVPWPFDRFSDP